MTGDNKNQTMSTYRSAKYLRYRKRTGWGSGGKQPATAAARGREEVALIAESYLTGLSPDYAAELADPDDRNFAALLALALRASEGKSA